MPKSFPILANSSHQNYQLLIINYQLSTFNFQLSVFSFQFSVFSFQFKKVFLHPHPLFHSEQP
ncbi:MAG: hypothetical protein CW341_03680 [Bacteroidetes bacterium]|nr:hypothetical protein [Bacteroidota bacterium]